jgi:two-component system, sensor histidine kinase YesM
MVLNYSAFQRGNESKIAKFLTNSCFSGKRAIMKKTDHPLLQFLNKFIFLHNRPLTIKLFVFSALLVIVPLVLVGIVSYQRSANELEDEARIYSWQVIDQVKTHIEYYVRDIEVMGLKIINDPNMIKFLRIRSTEEFEQSDIRSSLENLIRMAAYSRPDISDITIVLDGIRVINSLGRASPYPADQLEKEYWYALVPNNGSPLLVSRVVQRPTGKEPVLTLAKRLYSPQTLQPVGMLIIDVNFRRLQEIADKFVVHKGSFFILDGEGYYVYHSEHSKIGTKTALSYVDRFFAKDEDSFIYENKDFLNFSNSPYLGWRFVSSKPYLELQKSAAHIGETILWTICIMLIVTYVLGYGFARTLVRPIRKLQMLMKNVEVGDFSEKVVVESSDEIGQLSHGFNKMVKRLSELLEEVYFSRLRETEASLRQKEMEVKILQSQINPHFLCNSLETIRGMALEKGNEDIGTMASSLGILLRYNLRNSSPTVTLGEEVRFCEVYLQIQHFRFDKKFHYEFNIPDWAWDQAILKFSLQPLVENCFIHGLGVDNKVLRISIDVKRDEANSMIVQISDTGRGIESDILEKIRTDLAQKDITGGGPSIGIINVHRRIQHIFGPVYGVSLDSEAGVGTIVSVRLPMIQENGPEGNHVQRITD